jgi:hypothetical protein
VKNCSHNPTLGFPRAGKTACRYCQKSSSAKLLHNTPVALMVAGSEHTASIRKQASQHRVLDYNREGRMAAVHKDTRTNNSSRILEPGRMGKLDCTDWSSLPLCLGQDNMNKGRGMARDWTEQAGLGQNRSHPQRLSDTDILPLQRSMQLSYRLTPRSHH